MKKIIVFVSVLFVTTALMFCLISQSNAIAATLEVGAGKTYAHPQDAVNAANPGDTILVYPGTYGPRYSACGWGSNETACGCGDWNAPALIVYKDNLTIQATGTAAETIIQSTYQCWSNPGPTERSTNGAVSSVTAPNGVSVIASGVTIEGFTLRSEYVGDPAKTSTDYPNTAGIMIGALYAGDQTHLGVTGTAVKNCIIYGHSGIYNWKASNTTIEGNTITIIADTPYPNTVNGNGVVVWDGWFEGVFPPTSTGVKILNNNINTCNVDLAHGGEGKGIMFGGTDTKNTPCEWCPPLNPSDANGADQSGMLIQGNTICAASTGIKFWNSIGTNKVITCDNTITFGTYKIHDYGVDENYPPSTWTEADCGTPLINTNTECLEDGITYATVKVTSNTCITIEVTVDPNAFYSTGYNFGMQRFGFNYTGEITSISCYNDVGAQWAIELKENTQMDGFGTFNKVAYAVKPEGQNRVEVLYIEICGTDLSIGTCFSAHIADFGIAAQTGNTCAQCVTSAFFGSCPLTGTKKPAPTDPCGTFITLSSFTAKPGNGSVTLNWTTETEIDNAGFNIYRAESENGEYVKINAAIIPSKAGAAQGASYQFIDNNVRNRKTYYYKLEDIDLNGTVTMHGPKSATPKWIFGIFGIFGK